MRNPHLQGRRSPMVTQYIDVPDGRLAYDDQGTGQVVLCVPGLGDLRGEYRLLAPELVAGIILISPFARNTTPLWRARLLSTSLAPLFSGPWGPSAWIRYLRTLYPSAQPADFGDYLQRLEANLRQRGRMAALRGFLAANQTAAEQRLARVNAPALVIMGAKDRDFPDP